MMAIDLDSFDEESEVVPDESRRVSIARSPSEEDFSSNQSLSQSEYSLRSENFEGVFSSSSSSSYIPSRESST